MPVQGVLPVIPTPFLDGRFDSASFQRLLDHMLPFVDGYTLLGSTGEAPSLPSDERRRITEAALAMTPADKTVVVGVSHTSATESAMLASHAEECGAHAVLCSVPYYFVNSPAGVLRHLSEVDAAISIDLVLYDNPAATKTSLAPDWVLDWSSKLAHLTAVKLTDHNLSKVSIWQRAGLQVLGGDDPILFRYMMAGVDGVIVIAPALFPAAFRDAWDRAREGRSRDALAVFSERILPLLHVFGIGDEIATTKAILHDIGVFESNELLPPLVGVDESRRDLLRAAYALAANGRARGDDQALAVDGDR
jgi:4-hydroxy-tetrahydrodipicolinate synthase